MALRILTTRSWACNARWRYTKRADSSSRMASAVARAESRSLRARESFSSLIPHLRQKRLFRRVVDAHEEVVEEEDNMGVGDVHAAEDIAGQHARSCVQAFAFGGVVVVQHRVNRHVLDEVLGSVGVGEARTDGGVDGGEVQCQLNADGGGDGGGHGDQPLGWVRVWTS